MGGLFLLSRRSQGGPGGPGGQNAMNLGKSQAKFQMEPNTGITFDDVAGVEEAKNDFQEVQPCAAGHHCRAGHDCGQYSMQAASHVFCLSDVGVAV